MLLGEGKQFLKGPIQLSIGGFSISGLVLPRMRDHDPGMDRLGKKNILLDPGQAGRPYRGFET